METVLSSFYIHAIGEVNDGETYKRLKSIIEHKNIYSRQKMDKLGIQHTDPNHYGLVIPSGKENMFYSEDIHYNLISLHDPKNELIEKLIINNTSFSCFSPTKIALAVSKEVPTLPINETRGIDIGEVQVKDSISIDYIVGIIIPNNEYLTQEVQQLLCESLNQKFESEGLTLPIYDYQGNILYQPEQNKKL